MSATEEKVLEPIVPRTADVAISENINFSSLLLSPQILKGLAAAGFERPSPIQLKAIPLGRCGLDLIVQAKSGTGKTCVFAVIALDSLQTESVTSPQVLILAPTREIAVQIQDVIRVIGTDIEALHCHTFIGGLPVHQDKQKLRRCHIAVGTPGRMKQLIEEGILSTENIRLFVLDEADKLVSDDFQEQINWIYWSLPQNKQMIAASATYPEVLANHLTRYMRNPTFMRLSAADPALIGIKQYYEQIEWHPMPQKAFDNKVAALLKLLAEARFNQALVFSNYQLRAESLCEALCAKGWPANYISGAQDQYQRLNAMSELRAYKCRVLVSTDLTARGIDVQTIDLVVNLDVPKDTDTYLHRIGRAGRFGAYGAAVTLACEGSEMKQLMTIVQSCKAKVRPLPDPIPEDLTKMTGGDNDMVVVEQIMTDAENPQFLPLEDIDIHASSKLTKTQVRKNKNQKQVNWRAPKETDNPDIVDKQKPFKNAFPNDSPEKSSSDALGFPNDSSNLKEKSSSDALGEKLNLSDCVQRLVEQVHASEVGPGGDDGSVSDDKACLAKVAEADLVKNARQLLLDTNDDTTEQLSWLPLADSDNATRPTLPYFDVESRIIMVNKKSSNGELVVNACDSLASMSPLLQPFDSVCKLAYFSEIIQDFETFMGGEESVESLDVLPPLVSVASNTEVTTETADLNMAASFEDELENISLLLNQLHRTPDLLCSVWAEQKTQPSEIPQTKSSKVPAHKSKAVQTDTDYSDFNGLSQYQTSLESSTSNRLHTGDFGEDFQPVHSKNKLRKSSGKILRQTETDYSHHNGYTQHQQDITSDSVCLDDSAKAFDHGESKAKPSRSSKRNDKQTREHENDHDLLTLIKKSSKLHQQALENEGFLQAFEQKHGHKSHQDEDSDDGTSSESEYEDYYDYGEKEEYVEDLGRPSKNKYDEHASEYYHAHEQYGENHYGNYGNCGQLGDNYYGNSGNCDSGNYGNYYNSGQHSSMNPAWTAWQLPYYHMGMYYGQYQHYVQSVHNASHMQNMYIRKMASAMASQRDHY